MAASKLYGAGEPPYFNIYVDVALSGNSTAFETYFPPMDKYFSISVFSPGKNKFATVFTDVTYRKRSEEHINILNQELTEKNKELEQIVYAASHDLRSPLVNIQGFTRELQYSFHEVVKLISETSDVESIRENLNSRIRKDVEDAFDFISKSTAKMDSLLSGLLRLSRLGRSALTIKRIHMNGLISDIVKTFEYRIQQAGITVEWEDLPDCYGDESMINQVFSNLIDNAVKFMDSGRPGRICVSGVVKNAQTVYCVQDNGIGIALEYHKKIFALFHRLDPKISGEGLGLSIIRKIVERHGGKIWVESEPGAGTKFYLSFENTERKGVNE
jgi:signal transduction histidine kinase